MAMTKAEKACMESLKKEVKDWKALAVSRGTPLVERDLIASDLAGGDFCVGWDYVLPWASYGPPVEVFQSWTKSHFHGRGDSPDDRDRTWSQNGRDLFSTKEKALMAARYELESRMLKRLYQIDKMIEEERAR